MMLDRLIEKAQDLADPARVLQREQASGERLGKLMTEGQARRLAVFDAYVQRKDDRVKGKTRDIAREVGVSPCRVNQMLHKVRRELRIAATHPRRDQAGQLAAFDAYVLRGREITWVLGDDRPWVDGVKL